MFAHRARHIALGLVCLVVGRRAAAQSVVTPGARVRVVEVSSGAPLVTGELIRMAGDTVLISSAAATQTVWVVTAAHRLEVSAGTHRRTLRGIGLGFLVGAATGAVIGLATYQEPDCIQFCIDLGRGFTALAGAAVLSVPGAVIGGIVGAKSKHEAWRPIANHAVRLGIAPAGSGGVLLAASVAF